MMLRGRATIPLVLLAASGALGGECRPEDPLGVVARLPATTDAVIVIEAGARQRSSAAGRALSELIAESGLFRETLGAWCSLAASMEVTPEEAFDLALGQRAIVVIDGVFEGRAEGARWALLSHVCPRTESRLRKALRPAPRSMEMGRPILAVENGAYELATMPACRAPQETGAMILLAPSGDSRLFDSLVPVIAGKQSGARLSDSPSWEHALRLGGGDVVVYLRRPRAAGGGEDFLVCSATCGEQGWSARFSASTGMVWSDAGSGPPGLTLPGSLDELAEGAMAMYAGPLAPADGAGRRTAFSLGLPVPQRVPSELSGVLGPTIIAALHDGGPGEAASGGWLSLSLAVQTRDGSAPALGDRMLARMIARRAEPSQPAPRAVIETVAARADAGPETAPQPIDFEGLGGSAARIVELTDRACAGDYGHVYLSWSFAGDGGDGSAGGWWLINLLQSSTGGAAGERSARRALARLERATEPGPGAAAPGAVSRGLIRPCQLARTLGQAAPRSCSGFLGSLRWVESVQWEIGPSDGALIAGSATVRMRAAP